MKLRDKGNGGRSYLRVEAAPVVEGDIHVHKHGWDVKTGGLKRKKDTW